MATLCTNTFIIMVSVVKLGIRLTIGFCQAIHSKLPHQNTEILLAETSVSAIDTLQIQHRIVRERCYKDAAIFCFRYVQLVNYREESEITLWRVYDMYSSHILFMTNDEAAEAGGCNGRY